MATISTVGHSTRELEEFIEVLRSHGIKMLVDIRAFPASRRLPHFNREAMEASLPAAGIEYRWMKELGGRRKQQPGESPHVALRNDSFRNYADYMLTSEFQDAARQLVGWAAERPTAIMCAEKLYFHCHRMMVSDHLVAAGHQVLHLMDAGVAPKPHALMAEARILDGRLIYRGDRLL